LEAAAGPCGQATNGAAEPLHEGISAPALSLPSNAAGLLRYLRADLCCRVWRAGDMLMIGPTHRCPPAVVVAALALLGELTALVVARSVI
jgi:hypothetical protein